MVLAWPVLPLLLLRFCHVLCPSLPVHRGVDHCCRGGYRDAGGDHAVVTPGEVYSWLCPAHYIFVPDQVQKEAGIASPDRVELVVHLLLVAFAVHVRRQTSTACVARTCPSLSVVCIEASQDL